MTVKVLLTTLMVLSLGGCSLAPTVEKPEPSMPENWTSARLSADEKLPLDWWRGYGDPALVTLVEEALDANNDLQLAAARVAEARALLTGQQAEQYPLLEVEGSAVRQGPSEEVVNPLTISRSVGRYRTSWIFGGDLRMPAKQPGHGFWPVQRIARPSD